VYIDATFPSGIKTMTKDSIAKHSQSATELALQAARSISARSGTTTANALSEGFNALASLPPGISNALAEALSKNSNALASLSPATTAALTNALSGSPNALASLPPGTSNALAEALSKNSNALASLSPATTAALTNALSGGSHAVASLRRNLTPIHNTNHFGELVRLARQKQGLSQQHLADAAGVGRRFLSEVESGKSTLEFGKVLQVAAAAGIDLLARLR
jgi:y4mF family transcriptional regulator